MELVALYATISLGLLAVLFGIQQSFNIFHIVQGALSGRIFRYIVYPRVLRGRHLINPRRGEALLHFMHWAGTAICNIYGIDSLSDAGLRAGGIAVVHLVPLLASRQLSFIADISGLSVGVYQKIHASLGLMTAVQVSMHAAILFTTISASTMSEWVTIFSMVAVGLLAILPFGRRYAYELFSNSHLALAITLALALWEHLRLKKRLSRLLLIVTSICFLVSSVYQYSRQIYRNAFPALQLTRVASIQDFGSSLILELRLGRPWRIQPGQYVMVTLLTFKRASFFQRHPFAITWWSALDGEAEAQAIYVMIEPRQGWTRRIMLDAESLENSAVWLDGPFGIEHNLNEYGCVVMFASGTGVFACLPLIKGLTEQIKASAARTRRIKLIWQTDQFHNKLQEWIQPILDDEQLDLTLLNVSIHTAEFPEKWEQRRRLKISDQIPNVQSYLNAELRDPRRSVAVVVSAHPSLRHDIRRELLAVGRNNARLIETEYQPNQAFKNKAGTAV